VEKITKFIECLVPVSICNLECEYCYVIQQNRRKMDNPKWRYDVSRVAKALNKERLGGMAYISICGAGETLVSDEVVELVPLLLKDGHAVNITTNGTLTRKIDKILENSSGFLDKLMFSFSFHFLELKKKNLIDVFFDNIEKVKKAGCSFVFQFNLYDGYVPYLDEIKKISIDKVGALPQVALTRKEVMKNNVTNYCIHTKKTDEEYIKIAREFKSPLFEFTLKNFNVKRREFCYAGMWSGVLNLQTGILKKCYGTSGINIFENIEKQIDFTPVGKHCPTPYCVNSSHFISLGVIPEIDSPSYGELRNRKEVGWYNETMKILLDGKLFDVNPELSKFKKLKVNIFQFFNNLKYKLIGICPASIKNIIHRMR